MRDLTGDMQTAVAAQTGTTVHLISLEFSGGTIFLATLPHDVDWDGETWVGIGGVLGFAPIAEAPDLRASGVPMKMSGVDQTIIAALLSENFRGRSAEIYRAKFAADGTIVADPINIFTGRLNSGFEIRDSVEPDARAGSVEITTLCVSDLAVLAYARGIRTNMASHQAVEPDDTFFQHVNGIPEEIVWGTNRSRHIRGESPPGGPNGPGGLGWH